MNKETSAEIKRIKEIINRKFDKVIYYRTHKLKKRKSKNVFVFEKLLRDIIFLIDNPDYKKIPEEDKIVRNPIKK